MARVLDVAESGGALPSTPRVELSIFSPSQKSIMPPPHPAVGQLIFMGAMPAVAIDLVPISRLEAVKRVPKIEVVLSVHVAPRVIAEAVAVRPRGNGDSGEIP